MPIFRQFLRLHTVQPLDNPLTMIRVTSFSIFFIALFSVCQAQDDLATYEKVLQDQSDILLTDSILDNRIKASDDILNTLKTSLALANSFEYPFDSINRISIQYPQDSSFRIFSWQVYKDLDHYSYGGLIQEKTNNRITELNDFAKEFMDPEFDIVNSEEWYGCVYYKIHDFESSKGKEYLVFGLNSYQLFENQKIVDVLSFDEKGPKFGSPVFFQPESTKAEKRRLVYTYSAETTFNMNYDPFLDLIVIDHLQPARSIGGTSVWVPDGTYSGYKLQDNKWVFEEKLFHVIMDEAPREMPVLDSRKGKDIFGKAPKAKTVKKKENKKS